MKDKNSDVTANWEKEVWGSKSLMERKHLKHETFLNCFCPHCDTPLNDGKEAVFEVIDKADNATTSKVAAYVNILEKTTSIHIDQDEEVKDVRCPHCHTSFVMEGVGCDHPDHEKLCGGKGCRQMKIHVSVSDSNKLELISCVRRSCNWYEMNEDDNERLILRDSHEW